MSSLFNQPLEQHHLSRVRPISLRDPLLHEWGDPTIKDPLIARFGDLSPPATMGRCLCTSRDFVLCARELLLDAVLSYKLHFRNPREFFFIRVFCRTLSSEWVERKQTITKSNQQKNTP